MRMIVSSWVAIILCWPFRQRPHLSSSNQTTHIDNRSNWKIWTSSSSSPFGDTYLLMKRDVILWGLTYKVAWWYYSHSVPIDKCALYRGRGTISDCSVCWCSAVMRQNSRQEDYEVVACSMLIFIYLVPVGKPVFQRHYVNHGMRGVSPSQPDFWCTC